MAESTYKNVFSHRQNKNKPYYGKLKHDKKSYTTLYFATEEEAARAVDRWVTSACHHVIAGSRDAAVRGWGDGAGGADSVRRIGGDGGGGGTHVSGSPLSEGSLKHAR